MQVLARLGLVDEYLIYLNPVVLGSGTPLFEKGLFEAVQELKLTLLESKPFQAGVVAVRYAVHHPETTP